MNLTYIQLLNIIESFASEHLQVKKFSSDFAEQLPNFATKDDMYPLLFVSPTQSISNINTKLFTVNIYAYDIIQADRANINTIVSDTNSILNDLVVWLNNESTPVDLIGNPSITPINNSLLDYCAGWVMQVQVEVDNHSSCEIPFNEFPVITQIQNNIVYGNYLTCETLAECPVIIDIQNSLTGATSDTFVTGGTHSNGSSIFTNNKGDTFSVSGYSNVTKTSQLINDGDDGVSHFISLNDLPSNLVLYPTTAASDVSGYFKLVNSITDPSYNTTAVDVSTGEITSANQLISSLVTAPNLLVGNPGVFNITTIGNITRTNGTGSAEFYFEVYKRTSGGTETLITTSNVTIPVINTGYAEFSATALWNDGIFVATDRIVLKFYGTRMPTGSNPTFNFQFGGTSPVRSLVPIPLNVIPVIDWNYLATQWSVTPTLLTTIASGDVWQYTLIGVTRYRLVPSTYNATQDSFYSTFDGTTLSGLITSRG